MTRDKIKREEKNCKIFFKGVLWHGAAVRLCSQSSIWSCLKSFNKCQMLSLHFPFTNCFFSSRPNEVKHIIKFHNCHTIQLQEYPIPPRLASASQKPSSANISETESGILDPLVSKQMDFFLSKLTKNYLVFRFLCDFLVFSNALSHHCTVAWVTRPERPKGVRDEVKQAWRATSQKSGPNGAPRLPVDWYCFGDIELK